MAKCEICEKEFKPKNKRQLCCGSKQCRNEYIKAWRRSNPQRYKEIQNKYNNTEQRKEYIKKYKQTEKYKEGEKQRRKTPAVKNRRSLKRNKIKSKLILAMGDKCQICGKEHLPICCYQFHHEDPTQKEFLITELITSYDIKRIEKEVEKCILVCANCHFIIHNNTQTIDDFI